MRVRIFAISAAMVVLASLVSLTTASATAAHHSRMWRLCHAMPIVIHRGVVNYAHPRKGPNENTIRAFRKTVHQGGRIIETDAQPSRDGVIFSVHDRTVNRTTNGHGAVNDLSSRYLHRLHTPDGSHLATLGSELHFRGNYPSVVFQYELKPYGWAEKHVKHLSRQIIDHHAVKHFRITSASASLLALAGTYLPDTWLEYIGFFNHQPSIATAVKKGFDQLNVTYVAAYRPYKGYRTYIQAARAQGLVVSVRMRGNSLGDNAHWWAREVRTKGVAQIVTNHWLKYRKWCNAR